LYKIRRGTFHYNQEVVTAIPDTTATSPVRRGEDILIVEDDTVIREQLAEALEEAGFSVRVAADGAVALEMMSGELPALVLLDLMLPHFSGVQLLREIQTRPPLQPVSVFVITAAGNVGRVPPGIPVFVKPLALLPLITAITRLVPGRPVNPPPRSI
jgi:CheY-like chemotaxis protein